MVQSAQGVSADGGQVRLGAGGGRCAGTGRGQPDLGGCPTSGDEQGVKDVVYLAGWPG